MVKLQSSLRPACAPLVMPARPNPALRRALQAPVWLYRWQCGRLLGRRFLLLCHKGRRTGITHRTVLEVMEYREALSEAIVMSAWGRGADWLRNIEATPDAVITIGSREFAAIHRLLDVDEAATVIGAYEQRNWLIAPIIRIMLSRFLGWRYRGSASARRKAAAQLPLVAFRPLG
jgi:deazaflavin-dependent oxidoreductase (nitroreductase family)